jgi:uncharacterized protein YegL
MSNIEVNPNKEYIIAGDISASMTTIDSACGGNTRYAYMLEKFKQFIQVASDFDEHGSPTIIMFGERAHVFEHCDLKKVNDLTNWQNFEGFTNLHLAIDAAFGVHKEEKREQAAEKKFHPGTVLMVFTDGDPTNRAAVKRSLEKIVNSVDSEDEFQVIFLTVGTVTRELSAYLEALHDELEDKSVNPNDYDIIHVEKLEDVDFFGAVKAKDHDEQKVA